MAVDRQGWPVAWDILPGSTGDIPAFVALLTRLRERFRLGRVIVVADRGMVSAQPRECSTHPTGLRAHGAGVRCQHDLGPNTAPDVSREEVASVLLS